MLGHDVVALKGMPTGRRPRAFIRLFFKFVFKQTLYINKRKKKRKQKNKTKQKKKKNERKRKKTKTKKKLVATFFVFHYLFYKMKTKIVRTLWPSILLGIT